MNSSEVIIRVNEELTPEEEAVFRNWYPNCIIIVEKGGKNENKN